MTMAPVSKTFPRDKSGERLNFLGGAAVGAVAGLGLGVALHRGTRRRAMFRLLFAVAVGAGAYWQEKRRARELAAHLRRSGYPLETR
jgi:uncharacterized protein YfiM (DUF2279 family)